MIRIHLRLQNNDMTIFIKYGIFYVDSTSCGSTSKYIRVSEKQFNKIDKNKVNKHRQHLEREGEMMPIDVVQIDKDFYCICGNGRHRYFGALEAGIQFIEVNLLNGPIV